MLEAPLCPWHHQESALTHIIFFLEGDGTGEQGSVTEYKPCMFEILGLISRTPENKYIKQSEKNSKPAQKGMSFLIAREAA